MRAWVLLVVLLAASAAASADWFRYSPPPLGRLVIDRVLDGPLDTELRLPRKGRYYVELIRERGSAAEASAPLAARLEFQVARGKRVLLNRAVDVHFAPDDRARTLFWLNVPDTLPDRTRLGLSVALAGPSPDDLRSTPLRLQITRKPEMRLPLLR